MFFYIVFHRLSSLRETALEALRTYGPPLIGRCAAAQESTAQRDSLEALENLIYSCCPELNPSGE